MLIVTIPNYMVQTWKADIQMMKCYIFTEIKRSSITIKTSHWQFNPAHTFPSQVLQTYYNIILSSVPRFHALIMSIKIMFAFLMPPIHTVIHLVHWILLDITSLIIIGQKYNLWNSSLQFSSFLQYLIPHGSRILFSCTFSACSSPKCETKFHTHIRWQKYTGCIKIFLPNFQVLFLESIWVEIIECTLAQSLDVMEIEAGVALKKESCLIMLKIYLAILWRGVMSICGPQCAC